MDLNTKVKTVVLQKKMQCFQEKNITGGHFYDLKVGKAFLDGTQKVKNMEGKNY